MKRFLAVLLLMICCYTAAFAETASEPDLDLTVLSGHLLMNTLSEICSDPADYAGWTVRVRGQYYSHASGEEIRHTLIVTDCGTYCSEIGIAMVAAEGAEISWPENNQVMEITAVVEPFETSAGGQSVRLAVVSVLPC